MRANDLLDILCRAMDGNEATVEYLAIEIVDKQLVRIDDDQRAVFAQMIEHGATEGAHPRSIFHEQAAVIPIDRCQHLPDGEA